MSSEKGQLKIFLRKYKVVYNNHGKNTFSVILIYEGYFKQQIDRCPRIEDDKNIFEKI